jgi:nitroimidazol reductase NimA-like FMN-containing flavoprotein (pyridoxamine 5'-phosphate oxidase superfamily)
MTDSLQVARPMRQSQREITDTGELEQVLANSQVCHLAINKANGVPYIVALNYGYDFDARERLLVLWFHCADQGLKLDLLQAEPQVGFQVESHVELDQGSGMQACDWGMKYESIVGEGRVEIVEQREQRLHGLNCLMRHYGGFDLPFIEQALARTVVLRLDVHYFTGKRSSQLWPQIG